MKFDFASPTRVVFGPGCLGQAAALVRTLGTRALVVTGRDQSRAAGLMGRFAEEGIPFAAFRVRGEPTLADVRNGVFVAREARADLVMGFGGGSALDAAKAIAAMVTNPGDVLDYVEVIGQGRPLTHAPLPFMAIPTTAGTGSELTRNAVLASPEHTVKVSLRSPLMQARIALVDPELTLELPPNLTASTGMDALTQCLEAYVSCRANPLTDAFCVEGLRRAARSLRRAYEEGDDLPARSDMALAALYSGFALANAGLGAVHGFAGPIGGRFPAPHGAVCAALLAPVMRANVTALRERQPAHPALQRFEAVARWLTQDPDATIEDGMRWVEQLTTILSIPRLGDWGVRRDHLPEIAAKAAAASSMKGNPIPLVEEELQAVLAAAL